MNYGDLMQIAKNYVSQRNQNNMPVRYNDTVCVLHTCRNNIFTGFSGMELNNQGLPVSKHAEKDVINNMLMYNDLVINCFAVFNASTMNFVPPCQTCIQSLLRLHPANSNAAILLPSQVVWLGQAEMFFYHEQSPPDKISNIHSQNLKNYYQNTPPPVSNTSQLHSTSSALYDADDKGYEGTLLKKKLNMLFDDGDDEEPEENNEKSKKKRFGLFGL